MEKRLYVIGIGYKPLDKRTGDIIRNAEVILASGRLFEVFKGYDEFEAVKDKVKVINNVDETINFIHSLPITHHSSDSIVLLASGDPMFFGIGRRAVREFGKDHVEIIPDLSSIQLAFSRLKEPWDDAFLMSLHGGPDPEKRRRLPYEIVDIPLLLQKHDKIAILTDRENNPSEIARVLNSSLITHNSSLIMYVCERLGYPDERIIEGTPEEIAKMSFKEPNVVIIKRLEEAGPATITSPSAITSPQIPFGLKENELSHSKGLITKDEVRAITIHKLRIPQRGIFWDIGAGSGSVSIEVARLFPFLKVLAIERKEEQLLHLRENRGRFNVQNVEIVKGEAPDVLKDLPLPDRIFIGGSGGRLKEIIEFINQLKWSGILVINATTLETLSIALELLKESNYLVEVCEALISRLKPLGDKHRFSTQNPVFIITGQRQGL